MSKSLIPPKKFRIGIVGTGFIAVGLSLSLRSSRDLMVSRILSRRDRAEITNIYEPVTRSVDELLDHSDLIVECSGDILHGADVVDAAMEKGLPVVTMGSEFHATVGSYFAKRGSITEAEGDQPGSLAALHEEVVQMGFKPLVYGNIKGFLNHHPTVQDMEFWSKQNGISVPQVTSFTDGTKLQIEQVLVANGLGAKIAKQGMFGLRDLDLKEAAVILAQESKRLGSPISDYVINPKLPAGVFIVSEHPTERPEVLKYLKLGEGPYYTLLRPYHLCHLEMSRTIRRVLSGQPPLLNNGIRPHATVVPIAKRDMAAGHEIKLAIGGTDLRGEAVQIEMVPDAPPLGLLTGARLKSSVERGQILRLSDVDIPESLAKRAWEATHASMMSEAAPFSPALVS